MDANKPRDKEAEKAAETNTYETNTQNTNNRENERADKGPTIRPMGPDEKGEVKRIARQAFGLLQGVFVKPTEHTFVYELSGEIAGAVVLDTFTYKGGRLGGVVKWLFTAPKAQGRGAAAALVDFGVKRLKELGCHELFTTVEGFNTPSSNRFADLGFVPLGPGEQICRYGSSMLKIGPNTFHTFDVGHFIWARPAALPSAGVTTEEAPTENQTENRTAATPTSKPSVPRPSTVETITGSGAVGWWATVFITAALFALQRVRVGAAGQLHPHLIWQLPAAIALVFGVRSLAMKFAARRVGIEIRYRVWETGLTLSALITLLFGGLFPPPGSYYPKPVRWSYRAELPRLAPVAAAGAGGVLALASLLLAYQAAGPAWVPAFIDEILALAVLPVQSLLVFELLLPFFPFASYNGRRVWDRNRLLWAILSAAAGALFLVRIFVL